MSDLALSERLKLLRKEKGLTQLDAARKINISNTTLSQYESGKRRPSFAILAQMADMYSCTTDFLLGLSDTQAAPNSGDSPLLSDAELRTLSELKRADPVFFSLFFDCIKLNDRDINTLKSIMTAYVSDIE